MTQKTRTPQPPTSNRALQGYTEQKRRGSEQRKMGPRNRMLETGSRRGRDE